MSRTLRRTRGVPHELIDYVYVDSKKPGYQHLTWARLKPGTREYSLAYWNIHGDAHSGVHGVPRWYRHDLNVKANSDEKARLTRALARGEEDELVFNPRKKNAGYYWW